LVCIFVIHCNSSKKSRWDECQDWLWWILSLSCYACMSGCCYMPQSMHPEISRLHFQLFMLPSVYGIIIRPAVYWQSMMLCWYLIRMLFVAYSLEFFLAAMMLTLLFDWHVVLWCSPKACWLIVVSCPFRILASPHCTLSFAPLEETKPRTLDLELSLLLGLVLVLGNFLGALAWTSSALVVEDYLFICDGTLFLHDMNIFYCVAEDVTPVPTDSIRWKGGRRL
jgi:hypothetical protein